MDSQFFCQICSKEYQDTNLPRILTMCGHTYCQLCISKMITKNISQLQADSGLPFVIQCPEDSLTMKLTVKQLKVFPKNLALLKVLELKKINSSFKDESFNLSKIVKKEQVQEDEQTKQLISAIVNCNQTENKFDGNQCVAQGIKKQRIFQQNSYINQNQPLKLVIQKQKQQDELCLLHQKPLQIVCMMDRKKICSKCAIFGQHKGHDFKSVEEVEKQKNNYYQQILQIFKCKQEIEQRMSNQQTQYGLIQILNKKRDLLQKQVRQEFRKLRQQITKQEKMVLRKLNEISKTTEVKIKQILKMDKQFTKEFSAWQVNSFDFLKLLQQNDLQTRVEVLYSKQKRSENVTKKGNIILQKIKGYENDLVGKVQKILDGLQCKKNKRVVQLIPEFIEIVTRNQNIQENKSNENFNLKNLTVSTLVIEKCDNNLKKQITQSNCTIFDDYNKKNQYEEGSPLLQESLLDIEQDSSFKQEKKLKNVRTFNQYNDLRLPLQLNKNIMNRNMQEDSLSCSFIHLELESAKKIKQKPHSKINQQQEDFFNQNKRSSLILTSRPSLMSKPSVQIGQKPNKKKLKNIKISQKYQKMMDGIFNNTVDTIDLTNAQVGDQIMLQISQFVKFSKARTIKFIRNKLTDTGVEKILPALSNAQILNLSQNNLTQNVLDIFIKNRYGCLSGLKNLILSQNKIIQRKHKNKIDQLRAMNIVVSV